MAFRSRELYKKIVKKVGEEVAVAPAVMESVKKCLPNKKLVMGRAKRGIYAGRHIQFGNKVSEDGGNKYAMPKGKRTSLAKLSELSFNEGHFLIIIQVIFFRKRFEGSRRTWKPNVQEKRLFSYIHDRHIRVKVTTHALRCIDKAGGIDEYLLKMPYHKMDTEMGLFWKAKVEKMYEALGMVDVGFFSPEEEAKIEQGFREVKIAKKDARKEARRKNNQASTEPKQLEEGNGCYDNRASNADQMEASSDDAVKTEQLTS